MEHHANLVPWLMLKAERGIELRYLPLTDDGSLDLTDLEATLDGAKLLGVSAMSNVLGTINPISELAEAAHAAGALILVDGAQQAPHLPTDVKALGVDFFGLHRPQDARPDRDRRPVGPGRAARGHAAIPRRRRDDPRRPPRRIHHQRRALEVRGGHPAHRRGRRA